MTQSSQLKDADAMHIDEEGRPKFAPAKVDNESHSAETRKVLIPPHRMTPLRNAWPKIYPPLVEHLKLQVRMNDRKKVVELRTSKYTIDTVGSSETKDTTYILIRGRGHSPKEATSSMRSHW